MLAYLFERFPSFTQTFCAREVAALRALGVEAPVFSIRDTRSEPVHQQFPGLGPTTCLPAKFDEMLSGDARFRRRARAAQADMTSLWGSESEKRRIYEALWMENGARSLGVTHVHVHFAGLAARTAFWLNRLAGVTYGVTAHANDIFRDEPPERLGQVLGAAAYVVTVSDFSRDFLARQYPAIADRLFRVYNGIETETFPRAEFPEGSPLILSVGRAIEKKGFPDLIEACRRLAAAGQDFECVILGGGPLEAPLRESCGDLAGKIRVLGAVSQEEIRGFLRRARVFALPCVTAADGAMDNLPTVIMEAMACGLPVVSTTLAGIPEMVVEGVTGRLVPERNPGALAEAIAPYLADRELAMRQGAAGHDRCLDLFDIARTAPELLRIFQSHGKLGR